jgi:3-oxoacyl-[acyl-carrier-protein] synthase-3
VKAAILGINSYLPGDPVTNADLASKFPEWSVERIAQKTGIEQRHIASSDECSSDLAREAARNLFASGVCTPGEIDYLLFCTQSPDYFLPTTACLLQQELGIPKGAGALDFNLGCSGYVYGLGLAHGLIKSGQASRVLLLTAETYSKFLRPQDRSCVTIFGDGAAATLIGAVPGDPEAERPVYIYGTDGSGSDHLIVKNGGMRQRCSTSAAGESVSAACSDFLWMNGPEIFTFTLRVVPACIQELLKKAGKRMEDIDLFVFHQANRYMLDHLRAKLRIPEEKFYVSLASCGNTVSSTIPLALQNASDEGRLKAGQQVMLVGFGVGFSWGATLLSWPFLGASNWS